LCSFRRPPMSSILANRRNLSLRCFVGVNGDYDAFGN
jgi:hypothetical protein